jgi:hypothetical protein
MTNTGNPTALALRLAERTACVGNGGAVGSD